MTERIRYGFNPEGWNSKTGVIEPIRAIDEYQHVVTAIRSSEVTDNPSWDPKTGIIADVSLKSSESTEK